MNALPHSGLPPDVQQKYRDNFARHILSITLHLQTQVMNALTLKHGHNQLRINYEPYIAIAAQRGARLSDIAKMLGISRQAANQVADQIEAAGYLQRTADPSDGRAKLLVITPRAKAMIRQGSTEALKLQQGLGAIVGEEALTSVNANIIALNRCLGLLFPFEDENSLILPATLPRLSDYISNRLQALTIARGHPHLKRSFGTVLTSIGPRGGRIGQIANAQDVSKQAISSVAAELESLGYITREQDPVDARQVVLWFTASGENLIADSVASVAVLEDEFSEIIGDKAFTAIKEVVARIYRSLRLEDDIFGYAEPHDIQIIARQLNRQLGEERARALAHLLLSDDAEKHHGVQK